MESNGKEIKKTLINRWHGEVLGYQNNGCEKLDKGGDGHSDLV